jgi:peptide/nickel transport system substrate-binding protein
MVMNVHRRASICFCLLSIASLTGCGSDASADASKADEPAAEAPAADKPFQLGDMISPFTPPPLDELEKSVEWEDSPVLEDMALLRAQKLKEPPPLISVKEALAMRNDSPEANKKIISALSELAPEDGKGIDYEKTINRSIFQDLFTTNPILYSSVAESEYLSLTSFGLFTFDWEMTPFASTDSVVSWQTSRDRMYDKVVMRKDLVWSDGKPITAHDVVFSFKAIMTSQVPVPAVRAGTDNLKWIEAYDDYTLVFFHKAPDAVNVWNLNFPVIPKHVYETTIAEDPTLTSSQYHGNLERHPVTGGPYEFVEWKRGSEVLVRRRESFYIHDGKQVRDKPYYKQVRLRVIEDGNTRLLALKSGRIHESTLEAEQWETQTAGDDFYARNTKVYGDEWTFFYIGFNLKLPYFEDVRVRRALCHALDYDEMINDLCFGLHPRCWGIYHPDAWMFPKNPTPLIQQDLDKAENLLDEAGWVDSDLDGIRDKEVNGERIPFEFTLIVSQKPDRIDICNLFRENLDSIGIICHVVPLEAAVLQERMQKKRFEAQLAGWGTGTDPFTNENLFKTGGDRNYGSYSNPKVDELFAAGLRELDKSKRAEILVHIFNIFN